jgi:hypothetical protein
MSPTASVAGVDVSPDHFIGGTRVPSDEVGREGGDYALDFYNDLKTLQILDASVE